MTKKKEHPAFLWIVGFLVIGIMMLIAGPAGAQTIGGNESVLTEETYPAYWHDATSTGGLASNQSWRCGGGFSFPYGTHCYIETSDSVAGFRRGANYGWIMFLQIVDPSAVYRPHLIQPEGNMGWPYAQTVRPLTNPTLPPPALCLSAFACPY